MFYFEIEWGWFNCQLPSAPRSREFYELNFLLSSKSMWKWFIFIINANICIQKRHIKTARRQNFLIFKDILLETCRWLCDIFTDKYGFMKIVPPGVTIWLWDLTTLEYKHSPHLSGWGRELTVQSWRDFSLFVVACLRQTGHFISFIERAEDAELSWSGKQNFIAVHRGSPAG